MYHVHVGPEGPRVGELDEEMVFESRPGQTITLGASTWRVIEITRDRVLVAPAPGEAGRLPFWRGEGPGRPIELGRALGAFVREVAEKPRDEAESWLRATHHLDAFAARNLLDHLHEQREATGALPTDRAITIERFRDELGDWRVCILSPFGARVHTPWALALEAQLSTESGYEVQAVSSDDGIVLRFADADVLPDVDALLPDPELVEDLVVAQLGNSALFAANFRENAARALLLPRRRPGSRTPLWVQRLKSQNLLAVARQFPSFPIVLETYRSCLQDVFDVPGLVELLRRIRAREVRVDQVETQVASPFARSLVFAYTAAYLYQGDSPAAERRAQALQLDRNMLRDLLGQEQLRDLLDARALEEVEDELQGRAEALRASHPDALVDLLRRVGDLTTEELALRCEVDPAEWLRRTRVATPRRGDAHRRRVALDRRRRRRALPRCARLRAARWSRERAARTRRRAARAIVAALRAHARTVRGGAARASLRSAARASRNGAGTARSARAAALGRVPPGRSRARVVRRRSVAPDPPPHDGEAARRGRRGRGARARAFPAGVARHRRGARRRTPTRRGARTARRRAAAVLGSRTR